MVAYLKTMPTGIPGAVSRPDVAQIEAQLYNSATPFATFGIPAKISGGYVVPLVSGDIASVIYGWLVRPYPFQSQVAGNDPLGTTVPPTTGTADILRQGYMTVKNCAGSPAFGGQVYVRVSNAQVGRPIGCVEAASVQGAVGAADGGNTGNGTITASPATTSVAQKGVTKVLMTGATTYSVITPDGVVHAPGATGAAYAGAALVGLTFTVTVGGTPMVAGDFFTITTTPETQPVDRCIFQGPADTNGNVELSFRV